MASHPVTWFEIYVQDMDRARKFYEAVLQGTFQRLNTGDLEYWGFPPVTTGMGPSGGLVKVPEVASGGNSTLVYFECEDCAVEGARVAAAGGQLQREKMSIGEYGFVVLALDTEGNLFGLHSMK
jgi:predicted enzyme related to lactoylglutathione lyase